MDCISVSFKMAKVDIREKIAFSKDELKAFLKDNMVILSTCNRVEIYFTGYKINDISRELCHFKNIDYSEFKKYVNIYTEDNAIIHLYRVACGIDSKILGEDEILGQVKDAYYLSHNNISLNYEMNTIFRGAITSAKSIKTNTKMSKSAVSIGTLVASFVNSHNAKKVMIIGISGKIGTIVSKNILSYKNTEIIATSRNHNSDGINIENVKYIPFSKRYLYMNDCDIIISATSSPHYTVTLSDVKNNNIKNKIFIDLAVPRDIDEEINENEIYNIDYFENISKSNSDIKIKEIDHAKQIINSMIDDLKKEMFFHTIINSLDDFNKYSFNQLIYKVRDGMNYLEFKKFIDILKE
ncbi:MAG: glutamyl-tRNA reductase [Lachnospirales bacterium]